MRTKTSFQESPGPLPGRFPFAPLLPKLGQVLVPMLAAAAATGLSGCAELGPQQFVGINLKEHFPSSIYGPASPRVVADGQPVPRGGGIYMVGEPYKVAGRTYYPSAKRYAKTGLASWYGDAFHGRRTANGEVYDKDGVSAAHPTMPLPCYARITNLHNRYSMVVRVNDRGPFAANRIVDVSRKVAETLDFHRKGTTKVKVEYIGNASLAGSDDQKLLATLRVGGPAIFEEPAAGEQKQREVAENKPTIVANTDTSPSDGKTDKPSSQPISSPAAYFKGRPVPLPPARPSTLARNNGGPTKLALRRTSFYK